jgi:lipopolysaccharide transport system ATP-binding protein
MRLGQAKQISESYTQFTLQEIYGLEAQLNSIESEDGLSVVQSKSNVIEEQVIPDYHTQVTFQNNLTEATGWKTGGGEITSVKFKSIDPSLTYSAFKGGEIVNVRIEAIAYQDMLSPILGFLVRDRLGQDLFGENTLSLSQFGLKSVKSGQSLIAEFTFKLPMLPNGSYTVMTSFADGDLYENVQHHLLHDSILINVDSSKVRYGLVGLQFSSINLKIRG